MSRFISKKYEKLTPYVPGEQPLGKTYIKLNTNESPFPPSPYATRLARLEAGNLQLYSDPDCRNLIATAAEKLGVTSDRIIFTNGSDEILNFAFMAFCDSNNPAVFPDITYGFYKVFAELNGIPYKEIPVTDGYRINIEDYIGEKGTIFIANPNAQTGIALSVEEIEKIVVSDTDRIIVIDEAYVDFGGESALSLTEKYDNLLVVQTFSKSRSLAGARLGFGVASPSIIADLNMIRFSTNPYNINRMTMAAGIGALTDTEYFENNCRAIASTRDYTVKELKRLGFNVLPSSANFVFAIHKSADGKELYLKLKENGILIRHFDSGRLKCGNRISIGSKEEMEALIGTLEKIL